MLFRNDSDIALPLTRERAAAIAVRLHHGKKWNYRTFLEFLEVVFWTRCRFDWDLIGRRIMKGILEERRHTFADYIEDTVDNISDRDNVETRKQRSGFEFLISDFPEQMEMFIHLDLVLKWDMKVEMINHDEGYCKELGDDGYVYEDTLDEEEAMVMDLKPHTHYWWQTKDMDGYFLIPQIRAHYNLDSIIDALNKRTAVEELFGTLREFLCHVRWSVNRHHICPSVRYFWPPRRLRFFENKLVLIRPCWPIYLGRYYENGKQLEIMDLHLSQFIRLFPEERPFLMEVVQSFNGKSWLNQSDYPYWNSMAPWTVAKGMGELVFRF